MAAAGIQVSGSRWVSGLSPDETLQRVVATASGVGGYEIAQGGPGTVVLTRRYVPTVNVVLGIVGLLVCLIGVVLLFIKTTEVLTVTATPHPSGGTRLTVNGVGDKRLIEALRTFGVPDDVPGAAAVQAAGVAQAYPPPAATAPAAPVMVAEPAPPPPPQRFDGSPADHGNVAGWYPDPFGSGQLRYWDGSDWSSHTAPA